MFLPALLLGGAVALAPARGEPEVEPQAQPKAKPGASDPAENTPDAKGDEPSNTEPDETRREGAAKDGPKEPATKEGAEPKPGSALMAPFDALVVPAAGPIVRESCEAVRAPVRDPKGLSCTRWRVEWSHQGKVWGAIEAQSLAALQTKKARHVAFARQYARVFDQAQDPRYEDASPLICDQCDPSTTQGRWGQGQTFSGLESARALDDARERLAEFEDLFYETHAPVVTEVARLTGERKTATNAKRYAKQLALAAGELAQWQSDLHQAELLRSADKAQKVIEAMKTRGAALDKGLEALGKQVASAVATAHAGVYAQEGANPATTPTLDVKFDGRTVTATYRLGEASSVWFEGAVGLDGSLRGRSLMAPPSGTLTCKEHSEDCGYVHIPSMIRFSVRPEPRKEVLELWFQRDTWVAASPFSRD